MKETKEQREMKKYMMRRAIEPIQGMIRAGMLEPKMAVTMTVEATGGFSDRDHSPEYKRFKENLSEVFKDEIYFPASYMDPYGSYGYNYVAASKNLPHFLFKLYDSIKGKKKFDNPQELKKKLMRILKDKRLLEIGCGPGFDLKVLQDLGAKATGVEMRRDYEGRVPELDIRYGNALNLDQLCRGDEFDIIYTSDVFASACVNDEDGRRIAKQMYDATADKGKGFHFVAYEKLDELVHVMQSWISDFEKGFGEDGPSQRYWESNDDFQKEDICWTNRCTLDPQYLLRFGFNLDQYAIEDGDLIIRTSKEEER